MKDQPGVTIDAEPVQHPLLAFRAASYCGLSISFAVHSHEVGGQHTRHLHTTAEKGAV
jgi:hypothetical protein